VSSANDPAALADVLIVVACQQPSARWPAEIFARYPGLTLLLVTGPGVDALAHFRDGTVLALTVRPDKVFATARFLYVSWAYGVRWPRPRP
jgi:hypothetical protein